MNPQDQNSAPETPAATPASPYFSNTPQPEIQSNPQQDQSKRLPAGTKKKVFIIIGILLVLLASLIGAFVFLQNQANSAAEAYSKDTAAQLEAIGKEASYEKQVEMLKKPVQLKPVLLGSSLSSEYKKADEAIKPAYESVVKVGLAYTEGMVEYTSFSTKVLKPISDILNQTVQESRDILAAGPEKIYDILIVRARAADSLQKAADDMKKMEQFKSFKDYEPMIAALENAADDQRLWVEAYLDETESILKKGVSDIENIMSGIEPENAEYYNELPFQERVDKAVAAYQFSMDIMIRRATNIVDEMEKSELAKQIAADRTEVTKKMAEFRSTL